MSYGVQSLGKGKGVCAGCAANGLPVTSMSQLLGHDVALEEVISCILEQCAEVFNMDIKQESAEELNSYYVRQTSRLVN